jgi:hypothetical protein
LPFVFRSKYQHSHNCITWLRKLSCVRAIVAHDVTHRDIAAENGIPAQAGAMRY